MTDTEAKAPKKARDDFSQATINTLAKRAGYKCSVPGCHRLTIGAAEEEDRFFNIGTAAHIISASPDSGPRADPTASSETRKSINNGLWCCANHGRLIDSDDGGFSVGLLRQWKKDHEDANKLEAAGCSVGGGRITSITLSNLGRFIEPQTIQFGSRTLITGNNATGKRLICDMISCLSNFQKLIDEKPHRPQKSKSSISYEVFTTTTIKWDISIGDEITCCADGHPVPTLYSGFRVFHLERDFNSTQLSDHAESDESQSETDEFNWWEAMSEQLVCDLAKLTGLSRDGLLTALKIMALTPGKFFAELKMEGKELLWRVNEGVHFYNFEKLGGAEQQFVILDIFLRLAEFSARTTPTILILNQHAFCSMDKNNLPRLLKMLLDFNLQCQLVVTLYYLPKNLSSKGWSAWRLHESKGVHPVIIRPLEASDIVVDVALSESKPL